MLCSSLVETMVSVDGNVIQLPPLPNFLGCLLGRRALHCCDQQKEGALRFLSGRGGGGEKGEEGF